MENMRVLNRRLKRPGQKDKLGFDKVVYTYVFGGAAGTIYETILNLARGDGFVICNGCVILPFNFVYGVGAAVIVYCLRNKNSVLEVFFIGAAVGGAVEYILSFLEETILGTHSWDYTGRLLNINGRTTIPYMLIWGLLCVIVVFLVYNPFNAALESIPKKVSRRVAIVLAVIIAVDWAITLGALARYVLRSGGIEAFTFIGRFIDRVFDDSFMKLHFPKMNFT